MQFQSLWLQLVIVFFLAAASVAALLFVRRRAVAPLVIFGALILAARGCGFLFVYFASEGAASPVVQVLSIYASIAPSVLLLIYACLVQARRYKAARNNTRLRVWFLRAPYVHGGAVLIAFVGDLALRPPLLESNRGLPAATFLVEAPDYTTAAVYAGLSCYVFLSAARAGWDPTGLSRRLQNLSWGIAMGGLAVLALHALVWRALRAFWGGAAASLVGLMGTIEYTLLVIHAVGIVLGIYSYYAQGRRGRFVERFLVFLDLVGDLAEEMANPPVLKAKFKLAHAAMRQAAGDGLLDLNPEDRSKAENAFRAKVVLEHRASDGEGVGGAGRIDRKRLAALLEAYDYEIREPVLARGLIEEGGEDRLPGALRDVLPTGEGRGGLGDALALALRIGEVDDGDLASSPEWEQLVRMAFADAELLSAAQRGGILGGRGVSERVLAAYDLSKYELRTRGEERERKR